MAQRDLFQHPRGTRWLPLLISLAGFACKDSDVSLLERPGAGEEAEFAVSAKGDVQWKRYSALEADLSRALELDPSALCTELGGASCIRQVHLVPLGGNEPFETGILQASAEPLATTPAVIDRVLLSACSKRVALDRDAPAGQAAVFSHLSLSGPAPSPSDPATSATITDLYRRLLARDPTDVEVTTVAELAVDESGQPVAASDFARLACFAIGGSAEFSFY